MKYLSIIFIFLLVSCLESDDSSTPALSFDEQLAIDTVLIDDYLVANGIEAQVHESGIRFVQVTEGTGISPELTDSITVNYTGRFFDGEVFDQFLTGFQFQLDDLIPAWQIMIPLMKAGGEITIYSPSGYCYGSVGNAVIPPNANLIFDIELIEVKVND